MRLVVAGVGNVLRRDDGFGVAVAHLLLDRPVPDEALVMDVGIGGIHLVQELLTERADALIVVDASELGRPPGTLAVIRPDVVDIASLPLTERHDELADMHYATPERAFMLARGLTVLPSILWMLGCQPEDADTPGFGLTETVERAVEPAVAEVKRLAAECGVSWS